MNSVSEYGGKENRVLAFGKYSDYELDLLVNLGCAGCMTLLESIPPIRIGAIEKMIFVGVHGIEVMNLKSCIKLEMQSYITEEY